jgi:hypothetical protein
MKRRIYKTGPNRYVVVEFREGCYRMSYSYDYSNAKRLFNGVHPYFPYSNISKYFPYGIGRFGTQQLGLDFYHKFYESLK